MPKTYYFSYPIDTDTTRYTIEGTVKDGETYVEECDPLPTLTDMFAILDVLVEKLIEYNEIELTTCDDEDVY